MEEEESGSNASRRPMRALACKRKGFRFGFLEGRVWQLIALGVVAAISSTAAIKPPRPLLAGSLTWEVDPMFTSGSRTVTFTLQTAFELDTECTYQTKQCLGGSQDGILCADAASSLVCTGGGGRCSALINCGADSLQYGILCVDQYRSSQTMEDPVGSGERPQLVPLSTYNGGVCPYDSGNQTGTQNIFEVVNVAAVNGMKVVFGRKQYTVQVAQEASALIAYFANNVETGNPSTVGTLGPTQGVLMDQCIMGSVYTPCSVNTFDSSATPVFGLMKDASSGFPVYPLIGEAKASIRESVYWGKNFSTWPTRDNGGSITKQSPSLETIVQLCTDVQPAPWPCNNGTERLTNYFSPVGAFPGFAEFAVTPLTQFGLEINETSKYWWFKDGANKYKAPHLPIAFKSYDYDGHSMTQLDHNTGVSPAGNNRRAECFEGRPDGRYDSQLQTWPSLDGWIVPGAGVSGERKCKQFFGEAGVDAAGMDSGNMLKLDFDFGAAAPTSAGDSDLYGNVWSRCPSMFGLQCTRGSMCDEGYCSGSRVFSQHVINTVDFPFNDVDNVNDDDNSFDVRLPRWWRSVIDQVANPKSAISQTVFSAYGCWAGTKNQPPRFVASLEERMSSDGCNSVSVGVDDFLVPTEVTCTVNSTCVFPLHARDFNMNALGLSTIDTDCTPACAQDTAPAGPHVDARFQSCDVVQIYMTPGWNDFEAKLIHAKCSVDTTRDCVRDSDCPSGQTCTGSDGATAPVCESTVELGAAKCFYKEDFTFADAGKYFVRCFNARDPQGDLKYTDPNDARLNIQDGACLYSSADTPKPCQADGTAPMDDTKRTCSSPPLCVRIKVEGNAPYFVEPTPLEANSFDDNGQLVPSRTDVGACEGYRLVLPLVAKDDDPLDMVRIYLEDKDVDYRLMSAAKQQLVGTNFANSYNLDFFDNASVPTDFPLECAGTYAYVPPVSPTKAKWLGFNAYEAKKTGDNANQPSILSLQGTTESHSVMSGYVQQVQHKMQAQLNVDFKLDPLLRNGITVRNSDPEFKLEAENCWQDDATTLSDNSCRQKLLNMDQEICAYAYDNSRTVYKRWVGKRNPNRSILKKKFRDHSNGDRASPLHCWRVRMQAPPVFVTDPYQMATPFNTSWSIAQENGAPITGVKDAYPIIPVAIGESVNKTFVAWDPNPEDAVEIFIVGDPPPPSGMVVGRSMCIPRSGMCGADDSFVSVDSVPNVQLTRDKSSACSKARLTVSWTPQAEHQGMSVRVCAVARDSSKLCAGKGPSDATRLGWYGEEMCVVFSVGVPNIEWHSSSDVMATGTSQQSAYVGCQAKISAVAHDIAQVYSVEVDVVGELPEGAKVAKVQQGLVTSAAVMTWIPKRGMEGSTVTACFTAHDAYRALPPLQKACRTLTVQKCQYCVRGGDTLGVIMKQYGLDTNWLRLWLHNGNSNPAGSGLPIMLDNPDLMVPKARSELSYDEQRYNALGLPVIYVGPVYGVQTGDSLPLLARKFRTTISSILSVNPDIKTEQDVIVGRDVCLIPCAGQELQA